MICLQLCQQRRKRTDSVVLSISEDHAAVQSKVSGRSCRNGFQLCGEEIFLLHAIFFLQILQKSLFDEFLLLLIFSFRIVPRTAANNDIQVLALYHNGCFFLQLLTGQMDQKIRNTKNRILCFLADGQFNNSSILLRHNAMQCQRNGRPLVFLDTAVVMSIQKRHLAVLIQRILLEIQTRRINMSTQNIHTLLHRFCPDLEQYHQFFLVYRIHFISGFQLFSGCNCFLQRNITMFLCHFYSQMRTLALGLSFRDKSAVLLRYLSHFLQGILIIGVPCVFTFHSSSPTDLPDFLSIYP